MAENTTVLSVNMKPIPPRIYQSTKIAKDHYSKIMAARPRIDTKNNQQPAISKMTDPLKIYDLVHENTRICKNLIKIEKSPCYLQMNHYMTAIPKTRKSKHSKRKGRSVSQNHKLQITNSHPKKTLVSDFMKKEQRQTILKQNHNIIKRLESIRSTLGGWKNRQKQLSFYSKISRKRAPEDTLAQNNIQLEEFEKFRKTLIFDGKKGYSGHHSNRTKRRSRQCSSSLTGHRTIAII